MLQCYSHWLYRAGHRRAFPIGDRPETDLPVNPIDLLRREYNIGLVPFWSAMPRRTQIGTTTWNPFGFHIPSGFRRRLVWKERFSGNFATNKKLILQISPSEGRAVFRIIRIRQSQSVRGLNEHGRRGAVSWLSQFNHECLPTLKGFQKFQLQEKDEY